MGGRTPGSGPAQPRSGGRGVVLLSSEPYPFREKQRSKLAADPELAGKEIALIDGEMVSWYGSRAVRGLAYLRELRSARTELAGN